jgi:hypothetical protein
MRIVTVAVLAGLLAIAPDPFPLHAQMTQGQVDAMVKWGQAQDIHYDVVAEFAKDTHVLDAAKSLNTFVKDRFEVSFDWDPVQTALIGKPALRNFPSTVPTAAQIFAKSCQVPPPFNGAFDYVEIIDAKQQTNSPALEFKAKRTYPEGWIPFVNEDGKCGLRPSPAKTEMVTFGMVVVASVLLAMPQATSSDLTVLKDGKTIIQRERDGWTYTYTLRIVK